MELLATARKVAEWETTTREATKRVTSMMEGATFVTTVGVIWILSIIILLPQI